MMPVEIKQQLMHSSARKKKFLHSQFDLNYPKPTVIRQCLASLHEVVLYLPEMKDDILAAIEGIDLSKYNDSMSPLIKKDAEDVLGCLSAGVL